MSLSPSWATLLEADGHSVIHWSSVGSPSAPDTEIMRWARDNGYIVFTNDLDYGALLFATGATAPSVIQIRGEDVRPTSAGESMLSALRVAELELTQGALITVEPRRRRIVSLPLKRS
jgi:predicted nuclease of predicted toxin-antitoxin system